MAGITSRRRAGAAVLSLAGTAALALQLAAPAGAANGATFSQAYDKVYESCPWPNLNPECTASAAQNLTGQAVASAAIDSGAGGLLPGSGSSEAASYVVDQTTAGTARHLTATFVVQVQRADLASSGSGAAWAGLLAEASCSGCTVAGDPYQWIDGPGQVTIKISIDRDPAAAPALRLALQTQAVTEVRCDAVICVDPAGTAHATVKDQLVGVSVSPS